MRQTLAILLMLMLPVLVMAQVNPEDRPVNMDEATFTPMIKVGKQAYKGDSIQYLELNNIYCYPPKEFKSAKQKAKFDRLVYNVKKVLPIAKEVRQIMIETCQYMETLPNKRARDEHLKIVEKGVKEQYTPRMKKLTLSQGKLLIKLIYRETSSTGYQLINAFLGPVRAGFYQIFAWSFGASLKKKYEPEGEDADIERVARLVEAGQL